MMVTRRLLILSLWSVLLLNVGGCSSLVQGFVNTQPRVTLDEQAFEDPAAIVAGKAVVYQPGEGQPDGTIDADLARYAPLIVQGFQPVDDPADATGYDYWSDGIGSPRLAADGDQVVIDTDQPVVFSRTEHANVLGRTLKQLVYVVWYPRRPVGSIERGEIDGNVLRITLDAAGRPALFEYSQTCGCFHGTFAASHLEQWAHQQFTADDAEGTNDGETYALEKSADGKTRWLVRDLVNVDSAGRPVLYLSAGRHFCEAIRFDDHARALKSLQQVAYHLRPYDSLQRIPRDGGGTGSMFNEQGLVHGGKRWKEEVVLSDLKNPGWPRHLDQMLVHWDKEPWTDPDLLARHLQLPAQIADTDAELPQADPSASRHQPQAKAADLTDTLRGRFDNDQPFALLVTNRYCLGCEEVKNNVIPTPGVQAALAPWNYIVLDTFLADDAAIAARHRVDVTPVLIIFGRDGHEIARSQDIDTADKISRLLEANLAIGRSAAAPTSSQPQQ